VPGFGTDAGSSAASVNRGVTLAERFHPNVVAYVEQVMRRYDRNTSGKLEREEWLSARWRSDPASSDLNKDGVLTREELCERVKSYDEFRGLSTNSSGASGNSVASAADKAKFDEYARGLMRRYDENDNGVLDADEIQRMSSFHRGADANGDNVITRDELAVRLSSYGSAGNSSSEERSGDADGNRRSPIAAASSSGRSYGSRGGLRFRSASERLPKGLPDWFARNDADADGQISMAEFAISWTEEKLAEFAAYDRNGDGLITPRECLSDHPTKMDEKPAERSRDWRSRGR
jgi:Ca2+-binding EF-hand superfamily protein